MNIQLFGIIKNLSQAVLLTLLLGSTHSSYGAEQSNPQVVLEQAAKNTIERIELDKQIIDANPKHLHLIIEQELMPHIDHQFAAFKVLGKQFRSVPKAKIPEFVEQFRLYLIANFAGALASYGGQELIFESTKVATSAKSLTIKAIIRESGHPDIHLNFKLRKNKKTQEWKTFDLVAEGISLLSSKQTEFSSIMRREGIQAVIDLMKSKNNQQLLSNVNAE